MSPSDKEELTKARLPGESLWVKMINDTEAVMRNTSIFYPFYKYDTPVKVVDGYIQISQETLTEFIMDRHQELKKGIKNVLSRETLDDHLEWYYRTCEAELEYVPSILYKIVVKKLLNEKNYDAYAWLELIESGDDYKFENYLKIKVVD